VLEVLDPHALLNPPPELELSSTLAQKALIYRCRGIAYAGLQKMVEAAPEFYIASPLDPGDSMTKRCVDMFNGMLRGPMDLSDLCSNSMLESFNKPLPLPAPIRKGSKCIAGERYLLRHFGYKGNLLPEIEENEPINMVKVVTDIEVMENEIKGRQKVGKRPTMIWIGDSVEL